jgi:thiol-disulfide isomerase/thioredoxin
MKYNKTFWMCVFILMVHKGLGQVQPATLEIRFEKPNRDYVPLIDWENYEKMERKQKIDTNNVLRVSIPLERSQIVYINYLDSTNTIHVFEVFMPKSSTLKCVERNNRFSFDGDKKAVNINQFLQNNSIIDADTLCRKPLVRKISDEMYSNLMLDITDQKWQLYISTQDTTDATQNTFVKAALEAQFYHRVQFFVATKDWTDEMFEIQKTNPGRSVFLPRLESTYKPPFRIVPSEEAILSRNYYYSLMGYLGGHIYNISPKGSFSEVIGAFYDQVDEKLAHLPETREKLITTIFKNNWYNDVGIEKLMKRFENDFPDSKDLMKIRLNNWGAQKLKIDVALPPVPLLKTDSTSTTLHTLKGKPTLILVWNTWEDSCQVALAEIAAMAKKYAPVGVTFATICAKNRFDSWKEVLKKQWPDTQIGVHLYANYEITNVVEGIFSAPKPSLSLFDKEGKFVEKCSVFDKKTIEAWLKK